MTALHATLALQIQAAAVMLTTCPAVSDCPVWSSHTRCDRKFCILPHCGRCVKIFIDYLVYVDADGRYALEESLRLCLAIGAW